MSTNVIEFPTRVVREWIMVEKTIREVLEQAGASPEMTKEVCARMKGVYEKYNRMLTLALKLPLPEYLSMEQRRAIDDAIRNAVEDFKKQIHEYSSQVLLDRLCLEIELYKLRSEK
jgi:hypothetical protein